MPAESKGNLRTRRNRKRFSNGYIEFGYYRAKPNKSGWKIGLEDPSDEKKNVRNNNIKRRIFRSFWRLSNFYRNRRQKYHHILDVNTGFPVEDKKMVAVICQNGFQADLYSTSSFLMPIEEVLPM